MSRLESRCGRFERTQFGERKPERIMNSDAFQKSEKATTILKLTVSSSDSSYDIRHMAHIDSTTLAGKCLDVKLSRAHVTGSGTTVNVFCYAAGEADNED